MNFKFKIKYNGIVLFLIYLKWTKKLKVLFFFCLGGQGAPEINMRPKMIKLMSFASVFSL